MVTAVLYVTCTVNVGDGQTVEMSGPANKLDEIISIMKASRKSYGDRIEPVMPESTENAQGQGLEGAAKKLYMDNVGKAIAEKKITPEQSAELISAASKRDDGWLKACCAIFFEMMKA